MSQIKIAKVRQLDAYFPHGRFYIVCDCGYPVWQTAWKQHDCALNKLEASQKAWQRRHRLRCAGGEHTVAEMSELHKLQDGRCFYCHRSFDGKYPPTKDHLLAVRAGGMNSAINIVLACRSCNSRRGEIPFRTFCTLLSPLQNHRIVHHLSRRLLATDWNTLAKSEFECITKALALHEPRHPRYLDIKRQRGESNKGKKVTVRVLPRNPVLIIKRASQWRKSEPANHTQTVGETALLRFCLSWYQRRT